MSINSAWAHAHYPLAGIPTTQPSTATYPAAGFSALPTIARCCTFQASTTARSGCPAEGYVVSSLFLFNVSIGEFSLTMHGGLSAPQNHISAILDPLS